VFGQDPVALTDAERAQLDAQYEAGCRVAHGAGIAGRVCGWILDARERFDGRGPEELAADAIPVESRIIRASCAADRVLASRKNHRLVLTDDPTRSIELKLGDADVQLHLEESESTLAGVRKLVVSAEQIEIKASQKLVLESQQVDLTARSALTVSGKPIKLN